MKPFNWSAIFQKKIFFIKNLTDFRKTSILLFAWFRSRISHRPNQIQYNLISCGYRRRRLNQYSKSDWLSRENDCGQTSGDSNAELHMSRTKCINFYNVLSRNADISRCHYSFPPRNEEEQARKFGSVNCVGTSDCWIFLNIPRHTTNQKHELKYKRNWAARTPNTLEIFLKKTEHFNFPFSFRWEI